MKFDILFQSSLAIQIHVYAAVFSLVLGAIILSNRKATAIHKALGRIWVAAMLAVTLSSFAIHEIRMIGLFSPIHILSIIVTVNLAVAIQAARVGNIQRHQKYMKSLYFLGLITPGIFTLVPDRLLFKVMVQPFVSSFWGEMETNATLIAFVSLALSGAVFLFLTKGRGQNE